MGNVFETGGDSSAVLHGENTTVGLALLADAGTATPKLADHKQSNVVGDVALKVAAGTAGGLVVAGGKAVLDAAVFLDFQYPTGNQYLTVDSATRELHTFNVSDSIKNWVEHNSPAAQTYRNALAERPSRSVLSPLKQVEADASSAVRSVVSNFSYERNILRATNAVVADSDNLFTAHMIEQGLSGKTFMHSADKRILETARDALAMESLMVPDAAQVRKTYSILQNPTAAAFRPSLASHAFKGAIAAAGIMAADYSMAQMARTTFGEDSRIAHILRPNTIGTGMTAMAFVAPTDWRTRALTGTAAWVMSKGLNAGEDYFNKSGTFAHTTGSRR